MDGGNSVRISGYPGLILFQFISALSAKIKLYLNCCLCRQSNAQRTCAETVCVSKAHLLMCYHFKYKSAFKKFISSVVSSLAEVQLWWCWNYQGSSGATKTSWLGKGKGMLSMTNSFPSFLSIPFPFCIQAEKVISFLLPAHTFIMFKTSEQGIQLCLTSWLPCWEALLFLTALESKGDGVFFSSCNKTGKLPPGIQRSGLGFRFQILHSGRVPVSQVG